MVNVVVKLSKKEPVARTILSRVKCFTACSQNRPISLSKNGINVKQNVHPVWPTAVILLITTTIIVYKIIVKVVAVKVVVMVVVVVVVVVVVEALVAVAAVAAMVVVEAVVVVHRVKNTFVIWKVLTEVAVVTIVLFIFFIKYNKNTIVRYSSCQQ